MNTNNFHPRALVATAAFLLWAATLADAQMLASDDFEDGDSSNWEAFLSGWNEAGGVYHATNTAPNAPVASVRIDGDSWTDYAVEANVTPLIFNPTSGAGLVFRFQSPFPTSENCQCALNRGSGLERLQLHCTADGINQLIPFDHDVGQTYRLRATAVGSRVTCEVVGEPGIVIEANAPLTPAAGTAGLRGTHIPADFDNFVVTALATECAPGVSGVAPNGGETTFATIQEAVDAAGRRWEIRVGGGTYPEYVQVAGKRNLALRTECHAELHGLAFVRSERVTLDGFTINPAGLASHGIELAGGLDANTRITLVNAAITGADIGFDGVNIQDGNGRIVIENSNVSENGRDGVRIDGMDGGRHFILGTSLERNAANGIRLADNHSAIIAGNRVVDNGLGGAPAEGYGILRVASIGIAPKAIAVQLLNNLAAFNSGLTDSRSSQDLGNYDLLLDIHDAGNQTTSGSEGHGVDAGALLAEFLFEEGAGVVAKDTSGLGNDGNITGASYSAGTQGFALRFEDPGDTVLLPPELFDRASTASSYFEAWVKPSGYPSGVCLGTIFRKRAHFNDWELSLTSSGTVRASQFGWNPSGSADAADVQGGHLPLNVWSKVAMEYSEGVFSLFINDHLIDSDAKSLELDWFHQYFRTDIGNNPTDTNCTYHFSGDIDQVCIASAAVDCGSH